MVINRIWAMPNKSTFLVKPIKELVKKYIDIIKGENKDAIIIDPFVNESIFADQCNFTNDLNPAFKATYHLESLDFLKTFEDNSVDMVLFDSPFSPRQISECYKQVGKKVHMEDTQSSFYGNRKKEVARIVKKNGIVICFSWNSGGVGKNLGFDIIEILLTPHGSQHNDTISVVERKIIERYY